MSVCVDVCVFVLAPLSLLKGASCNVRINLNCIICCAAKEKKLSQWPKQNKYKYRLERERERQRRREGEQ